MRIGHTGDWHLCEGSRFNRTLETLFQMVARGQREGVQIWLVGGDLYNEQRRPMTPLERHGLARVFREMRKTAPVVLCYGNHDEAGELEIFAEMNGEYGMKVFSRPDVQPLIGNGLYVIVYVVPYPNKRYFVHDSSLGIESDRQAAQSALGNVIQGLKAQDPYKDHLPRVLLYHGNVGGSRVAGGEQMIGREVELSPHDIDELGADYAALSHIHLHQRVSDVGWYAGSPERSNFGETDEKGFLVVDVERGKAPIVKRIKLDTTALVTIETTWDGKRLEPWVYNSDLPGLSQCEIRVLVKVAEEHVGSLPDVAAMFDGAISVKVEKRVIPRVALRSVAITKATTEEEKLHAYWDSLGSNCPTKQARERALRKAEELNA